LLHYLAGALAKVVSRAEFRISWFAIILKRLYWEKKLSNIKRCKKMNP
jgi:hypothetical protein